MAKANRPKKVYIIFFVIAAIFLGVSLAISLPMILDNEKFQGILEEGTDTVGYNLQMHDAHLTVNEVNYFYLTFNYYDGSAERQGKTSKSFTQSQAADAVMKGSIDVRFNEDGAVEATFDKVAANKPPKLLLLVFGGISLVLIGVGVAGVIKSPRNDNVIEQRGIETDGIIEKVSGGLSVGTTQYYTVKVSFLNERGEYIIGATGYRYTAEQANAFSVGDKVKIKYYGKSVKILTSEIPEENIV